MNQKILQEDLEYILNDKCIQWQKLVGCKLLVTGATGLIGSTLVKALLYANRKLKLGLEVWCIVRDERKAEGVFAEEFANTSLHFLKTSMEDPILCSKTFDYFIHGASPTASAFFVEHPVETMDTAYFGTRHLLEKAKQDAARGFVYLSSMEAFGQVTEEHLLTEKDLGYVDLTNVRSSYQESKRICELLCKSYSSEYDLRTMSIRLAQTFGAGIPKDDKRVFAMMARCAIEGEDIVLMTKGNSRHSYLYTAQAVTAILCVLLSGEAGETYNAANPATYCSIYEMGKMVAEKIGYGKMSVRIQESSENKKYPPAGYLNLSVDKLSALGWKPTGTLADMYERMIHSMEN